MKSLIMVLTCFFLLGCGQNCRETVRMADFEASQGNQARAEKLYAQARAMDSVACPDMSGKRGKKKDFLSP